MLPTIAQVCSLNSPFERDVEDYAAGHCPAIEIWLGKLESYLNDHSVNDVRRLLEQHEIVAPVASYQGGLLQSQGEARAELLRRHPASHGPRVTGATRSRPSSTTRRHHPTPGGV